MKIKLPKGLKLKIVNNDNLIYPVGTEMKVVMDELIDSNSFSNMIFVVIKGERMTTGMPFGQCDCGTYTESGSWCDSCLDKVDLDEHEERKRKRLFEEQEY